MNEIRPSATIIELASPGRRTAKTQAAPAQFAAVSDVAEFLKAVTGSGPEGLSVAGQALAAPDIVWNLARSGMAGLAVDLIRAQPPEQQARILAASHAVCGLAYYGKAREAIELIREQPPEDQAKILSAPYVVSGLSNNGQVAAVLELIEAQPWQRRATILAAENAMAGLAHNGKGHESRMLQRSLNAVRLSAPASVPAF